MASSVSIANTALTLLNTLRISSLTDNSENARKINAIYSDTRDSLLSEHNWNFAISEQALSLLDEDTVMTTEWANIFQLPTSPYCLRVIRTEGDTRYKIFGRKLYSNESSVKIEYVSRVTDEAQFTPSFIWAFSTRLARDLSYGITENSTITDRLVKLHEKALNDAKWSDAQEGIGTDAIYGSLTDIRG